MVEATGCLGVSAAPYQLIEKQLLQSRASVLLFSLLFF